MDKYNNYHTVAYVSRALTPVEQRYSQTERKAVAIVWVCEPLYLYVYKGEFTDITDHKPLEAIFNNPGSNSSTRLQRLSL